MTYLMIVSKLFIFPHEQFSICITTLMMMGVHLDYQPKGTTINIIHSLQ